VRPGNVGDDADRDDPWFAPAPRGECDRSVDGPLDAAAVRADDDLIEALAAGLVPPPSTRPARGDIEGELVALLAGWVADIRPETLLHPPAGAPRADLSGFDLPHAPLPADGEPDETAAPDEAELDTAALDTAALDTAAQHSAAFERAGAPEPAFEDSAVTEAFPPVEPPAPRPIPLHGRARSLGGRSLRYAQRHRTRLVQVAAAATVLIAMIGGTTTAAYQAKPGETLWPITQVVFTEKARSVQAAADVRSHIQRARLAHEQGNTAVAQQEVLLALGAIGQVAPAEDQGALTAESTTLAEQLGVAMPGAAAVDPLPHSGNIIASGTAGAALTDPTTVGEPATAAGSPAPTDPAPIAAPAPVDPASPAPAADRGRSATAGLGRPSPGRVAAAREPAGGPADRPERPRCLHRQHRSGRTAGNQYDRTHPGRSGHGYRRHRHRHRWLRRWHRHRPRRYRHDSQRPWSDKRHPG
jgi:hypothetical protein